MITRRCKQWNFVVQTEYGKRWACHEPRTPVNLMYEVITRWHHRDGVRQRGFLAAVITLGGAHVLLVCTVPNLQTSLRSAIEV